MTAKKRTKDEEPAAEQERGDGPWQAGAAGQAEPAPPVVDKDSADKQQDASD